MLLSLEPRGQQSRPMLWLSPLLAAVLTLLSGVLLLLPAHDLGAFRVGRLVGVHHLLS